MTATKEKLPKKKKTKKKPAGDFDKIAKNSTWNLLTGCYSPFVHKETDHQESTTPDDNKDSKIP